VLDKPAGLLSVPGRGADRQDCASARAQAQWPGALIVHRLDMATSGVLLFARTLEVQRALGAAFSTRQVHKRYVAQVAPALRTHIGVWHTVDLPIGFDWDERPKRRIDLENGKPSKTRYCALPKLPCATSSRVALEPLTGRTHQLRLHLAAIGHPILGDTLYAPSDVQAMAARLLLHAETLRLAHPVTGMELTIHCAAPF